MDLPNAFLLHISLRNGRKHSGKINSIKFQVIRWLQEEAKDKLKISSIASLLSGRARRLCFASLTQPHCCTYSWYSRGSTFFAPLEKKLLQAFQPAPAVEPVLPSISSQHFHYKNRLLITTSRSIRKEAGPGQTCQAVRSSTICCSTPPSLALAKR